MELVLTKKFIKQASKLPKEIQDSVNQELTILGDSENLESSGLDIKRMAGQKKNTNYYRIRVGDWRIGIEINDPLVIIITILTRGDIYKKFPPK
jgi:mRNA interferase RelE/StbE